ncbi:hypothetical protein IBX73_10465 [candidate division WOR-3 bacterium]|nr:hypothetical protein [candidate division WOR-3 bacterium]
MKETLKVINKLRKQGVITDYAIGGGIAAIYYIEPILTYDLDVFVILPGVRESKVIDMAPLYERLQKNGYSWQKEHLMIEGVPAQFIPADELETEAIQNAIDIDYEGVKTRVFSVEYLIAILTRAGRPKDIEKVKRLLEQASVNKRKLRSILAQYGLLDSYKKLNPI